MPQSFEQIPSYKSGVESEGFSRKVLEQNNNRLAAFQREVLLAAKDSADTALTKITSRFEEVETLGRLSAFEAELEQISNNPVIASIMKEVNRAAMLRFNELYFDPFPSQNCTETQQPALTAPETEQQVEKRLAGMDEHYQPQAA